MSTARPQSDDPRSIPPKVYDIGFGWDPGPEVDRLHFAAKKTGVEIRSALELGCGTGRLLPTLQESVPVVVGIDLNAAAVAYARARRGAECTVGDMSAFSFGRGFDLIHASANTIRHVCAEEAISRMWRCIADHLHPGGIFVADLELGFQDAHGNVGKPNKWALSRGQHEVRVSWEIVEPPSPKTRCCTIRWTFESRGGEPQGTWSEAFPLRTYDAEEFVRLATADGRLRLFAIYEPRDPYLIETPVGNAVGRMLVTLVRN